jgi:hypothetical protein
VRGCIGSKEVCEPLLGDRTLLPSCAERSRSVRVGGTGAKGAWTKISGLELHTGLTTIFASQTTEILITNDDMKVHGGLQTPDKAIPLSKTNQITGSEDMHSLHCFLRGPGPLPPGVADEEERANIDIRNLEFNVALLLPR